MESAVQAAPLSNKRLWAGRVVDPSVTDDDTEAIRRFNDHAVADDRCDTVMLTVGDGITLCRKR